MTGQNVQPISMDAAMTQNNNQGNNKGRDNYFQSSIKRYGQNFHHVKTIKMLQYDAKHRLFREMLDGKINYDEFGCYFTDPQYLDILITESESLANEHKTIATALYTMAQATGNPVAMQLYNRHNNIGTVFGYINSMLTAVKATGYNNLQYLIGIQSQCAAYKNDFYEVY